MASLPSSSRLLAKREPPSQVKRRGLDNIISHMQNGEALLGGKLTPQHVAREQHILKMLSLGGHFLWESELANCPS